MAINHSVVMGSVLETVAMDRISSCLVKCELVPIKGLIDANFDKVA